MNRALQWLLLVFGLILAGTFGLFLYHLHFAPALAPSPAALVAPASPVQVIAIDRRRPDMLLVAGRAPNGSHVSLKLDNGEEVGSADAGRDGTFQLTTRGLPRVAAQSLTLSVPDIAPLQLLVIERTPQLLTLVRGLAGWQPLSHPATGSALLVLAQDAGGLTVAGQAPTGSTLYIYSDGRLVKKLETTPEVKNDGKEDAPALFTAALATADAPQSSLRIDGFNAEAAPASQLFLTLDKGTPQADARAWQKIAASPATAGMTLYVWRDGAAPAAPAKIADSFKTGLAGQYLPTKP